MWNLQTWPVQVGADVMLWCPIQINFRTQSTTHYPTSCKCWLLIAFSWAYVWASPWVRSMGKVTFVTPWTVACQAPFSMEYSRQETGVDCHFLLRVSSQPRDPTHVSCIVGGFFISGPQGKPRVHLPPLSFQRQHILVSVELWRPSSLASDFSLRPS